MPSLNFGISGLVAAAVTSLCLGFFVYLRNREGGVQRAWLGFSTATSIWAFSVVGMALSPSAVWAAACARIAQATFSALPVLFLRFSVVLVGGGPRQGSWIRWNGRIAALFGVLAFTPLLVRDIRVVGGLGFYPVAGPFYGLFAVWFSVLWIASLSILLQSYRVRVGARRNQLRYVILATVFGFISFLSMIPAAFQLPVAPMGQGLIFFYGVITYAIVRWRLMDISFVLKNTLIYASLYSILVGLFVVVVVFFGQIVFYGPQALDRRVLWMCVVALSIVTALVHPLDRWLRNTTDRLLFQKKYEWQKTLREASRGMTQVTSVDKLLQLMAHFIGMRLRVMHVGILHRASDRYVLKVSRGADRMEGLVSLGRDNPLVAWLEEKKEVLTQEEVRLWLRSEKSFPHRTVIRRTLEEVLEEMGRLKSQVCVPAFSKSQMLGLLVLGEKRSGDPYSQEDLDVLATLANEGAIALENGQLYEQLFQRMKEIEALYQREHRLFIHTSIALAAAVDARDPYTHGHTERSTAYALAIADEMPSHPVAAQNPHFKETLTITALLHDIGKIGIPDEILWKAGKLSPREMKKMAEHPIIGAIILQPIKGMEEVAKAVKAHHERFDGKGYPDGLRGEEIPLVTRIVSVADTFDSMTTDRPYRRRLANASVVQELEACSGTQFDPMVVEAFLRAYQKGFVVKRPVEAAQMLG